MSRPDIVIRSSTPGTSAPTNIKILVTGPYAAGKTTFIQAISDHETVETEARITAVGSDGATPPGKRDTTVAMDFGRIVVADDLILSIFGTPGQERFDFMWEILGNGMVAFVLLVDATRPDTAPAAAGIVRHLRRDSEAPAIVGLNRLPTDQPEQASQIIAQWRTRLGVPNTVPVLGCDARDRASVRTVVLAALGAALEQLPTTGMPTAAVPQVQDPHRMGREAR